MLTIQNYQETMMNMNKKQMPIMDTIQRDIWALKDHSYILESKVEKINNIVQDHDWK